jgi:tryptophan-rich sensory protein
MNTPSFPTATDSLPTSGVARKPWLVPPRSPGSGWLGSALGLAALAGASLVVAVTGGVVTSRSKGWYRLLRKSPLTPPDRAFSIVWPALYGLGVLSAWRIARTAESPTRTRALALWGAQLACNAAWTPLFFGAHRPGAAMADLALNAASLTAYAVEARKLDPIAAAMVLPNLAWLAFAGTLNAGVLKRNGGATRALLRG